MSTAVDQTVDWIVGLQKLIGDQLFSVGNRLASWLLLGNAGALVILFNQKLGSDFIPVDDGRRMAFAFCLGLFSAFAGIAVTLVFLALGYSLVTKAVGLLHGLLVNQHYIDKLESEGIEVAPDNSLRTKVDAATISYEQLESKPRRLWLGVVLSVTLYALSAAAFAYGVTIPLL
jgi:hypothetical protein